MADFLTAVSTKKIRSDALLQDVQNLGIKEELTISSIEEAVKALKSQPSRPTLNNVLSYLVTEIPAVSLSDTNCANIAFVLVNETLPNYWKQLKQSKQSQDIFRILKNPVGLGHLITRLRILISDSRQKRQLDQTRNILEHVEDVLDILDHILGGYETSHVILSSILAHGGSATQKSLLWKEYVKQTASGQLLALTAEAEDLLKKKDSKKTATWLADGNKFASWMGLNIAALIKADQIGDEYQTLVTAIGAKVLSMGYIDRIVASILSEIIDHGGVGAFENLLCHMKSFEQKKYLNAVVSFLIKATFTSTSKEENNKTLQTSPIISGAAQLVVDLTKDNLVLKEHLSVLLMRSNVPSLESSLSARRSIIAALAQDDDVIQTVLESSIKLFGDAVYIKHTPILQQEALGQVLALAAGYVHRSFPMFLNMMAKSTHHINGMSNRIGAASARARFLGIAVGTAISKLVDKPDTQLKFDLEDHEATESQWYLRLTEVDDKIGTIADLKVGLSRSSSTSAVKVSNQKQPSKQLSKVASTISAQGSSRVIEVLSDSEDEDEDLVAYEKPDSDPEDDGDEPETINRNKSTAPVYIRDLLVGLRDQDNYDRHDLALSSAASLIRRKANFGTEVTDHVQELATVLTGLQDNLELPGFAQQRQQALVAVLLTKPAQMAQWFAQSFFSGDYSLAQRIAMLTTMGIGARELAGLKDSTTEEFIPAQSSFPSKQLPPHLHKIYAKESSPNPIGKISSNIARQMLAPIASQAVDQLTGPNILKIRTFSSRMEVEKKRQKPIANELARIVAENFFFPLTGRWWINIRAKSDSIYTSTHLLPQFLQTLSIILNASGPNTLALPQMTREYWDLLLSIRGLATQDKNVLGALLFGFLMILETNENKERLASEQGKELMETQAWVKMIFEGLGAGSEEDEKIRVAAAGVVIRCQEVVEKYQRRLVGDLMDY